MNGMVPSVRLGPELCDGTRDAAEHPRIKIPLLRKLLDLA